LGLVIRKEIIDAHGDKIWIERDSKNSGSGSNGEGELREAVVKFTLPIFISDSIYTNQEKK